jgi:Ca2+-transporting ATPase
MANLEARAPATAGLSAAEAARRLSRDGPNTLPQRDRRRWPQLLIGVLREPMLVLLIVAAAVYLVIGETRDAATLAVSVLVVVALTLYQEWRSERALQALRELGSPVATVRRDGTLQRVPAAALVIGDVVRIAEGDRVPADARLLESSDLHVDESLLTGESAPVAHSADGDETGTAIHAGTLVVRGQASAEVTATGARTGIGRIGASIRALHGQPTPLQREIRRLVAWFAAISFAACVAVVALYVSLRGGWLDALLAGITLAMATIPEEFPVVLTVFLALGAWRMARQRVLVRRAPAIEALGAVTVLCTDKTGTLTENRMTLARLVAAGRASAMHDAELDDDAQALLHCAALASDADGHDPMDRAIHAQASARLPAHDRGECVKRYPVTPALPVYANAWRMPGCDDVLLACKGAPESVAVLCALAPDALRDVLAEAAAMAADGLRVLAVAEARIDASGAVPIRAPDALPGAPFAWRGLLGLADPLRGEVPAAVAEARSAGVRVVMLTGDHIETARAIAAAAGISERPGVGLGSDIERLDDAGLRDLLAHTDVFARVRPEHKLRLVQALQGAGEVVAMTGDGVNDAPALAAAHVGVAMGRRGTDVARESAAIVLLDDDFVSVVRAIRMGRTIYANIRRAARYIIAVHVPITGLALLPLLLGTPLVLLPLHVVFLEMIIDPASSIVLEREPPARDLMQRPPRAATTRLIDLRTFAASVLRGLVVLGAVIAAYLVAIASGRMHAQAAALAFAALVCGNLGLVMLHRALAQPGQVLHARNTAFRIVAAATLAALAAVVLLPVPAHWFGFAPVAVSWLVAAASLPLLALALLHLLSRRSPAAAGRDGARLQQANGRRGRAA